MSHCKFSFNLCIHRRHGLRFHFESEGMRAILRRGRTPQGKIHSMMASSHRLNDTPNIQYHNVKLKIGQHFWHEKRFIASKSFVVCKKNMFLFSHLVQDIPIKEAIYREEGLMIERLGVMSLFLFSIEFSTLLYFAWPFCNEWIHLQCLRNYVL